tara:strand:- start:1488 stop:2102 length:615 start_codon:yes stop_codon:yes gene_type:complete
MEFFESWVELGIAMGALLAGILIFILPVLIEKKKRVGLLLVPKDPIDYAIHSKVHEQLTELRTRTDAARSQVVQFHNGGEFLDGISMKKMSLTHESLANGISSELNTKQDILLSLCLDGLKYIKENNPNIIMVNQMHDSWCKSSLTDSGVIAWSGLPLRSGGSVTGYIMCQWCSWNKTDGIDEEKTARYLEEARNIIEVQLNQQ